MLQPVSELEVAQGDTTHAFYQVIIESVPESRNNSVRYEAIVLEGLNNHPKVHLFFENQDSYSLPQYGDTMLVYTNLQHPRSFAQFDYATYLYRQGISGIGYVPRWAWRIIGHQNQPWWQSSIGWQQRLIYRYEELGIHERELGTLCALTLGYREDLDADLQRQFSAAGAMHILAVSGLHTGILLTVLMTLMTLFGLRKSMYEQQKRRIAQGLVVIVCLVLFAILTGSTPSVVRSTCMACLFILAWIVNRTGNMLNVIFASAFIILLFRPMDLFAVSFQLSYLAVIAIVLFADGWNNLTYKLLNSISNTILSKICRYVLGIIGISVAAQIGTLPLTLYYFGNISNYFLITNIIVMPLTWLIMIGGLVVLTIGWWTPIGEFFAGLVNKLTWLLNQGVGWIEQLPGSSTQVCITEIQMWALLLINFGILIVWERITKKKLKWN